MATIQGVYVALFGRPADPTGLTYFNSVTKNGADLNGIGDLASTQEYKDRFAGQNNTQVVNSIYQSLFGRDAEAAGLTFFVNALNTGTLNIKNIAIAILDGAQGTDKTTVGNKVAAADLYTKSLDTAQEIGSYQGNAAAAQGRAFLAGVSSSVPSQAAVDAAILAMQAAGAAGNTITFDATTPYEVSLTTAYTNALGAKAFTTNNNDTINAGANFAASNKIDGGLGIDTVNVEIAAGGVTTTADTLKNVEIINATATGAGTLDVGETSGLTQIWAVGKTGGVPGLIVDKIALSTTVGVKGETGSTETFNFKDADSGSTANLSLNAVSGAGNSVVIANVGTVAVSNTGASDTTLTTAAAKTISITGDGTLKIVLSDTVLETVNASSFSGALTVDVSANDALKTLTSGSGNDTLTVGLTHTADIKIDAGAGNDTINVVAEAAATKAIALTGGAGADSFVFGVSGTYLNNVALSATPVVADIAKTLVTVTDFDKSADAIKFFVNGGATTGKANLTGADLATIAGQADILAAATKAAELANTNSGNSKVAVFAFGSDTYIYEDTNGSGTFNSGDALVKIAGLADISGLTASNFVLIA